MGSDVVHIPQGSVLQLLGGRKELSLRTFEPRGISTGCIGFRQNMVSFPQAYVGYINLPAGRIIIDSKHNGVNLGHIIKIYYFLYSSDSSDLDEPIYDVNNGGTFDIIKLLISGLGKVTKKGSPAEYRGGKKDLQYLRGNIDTVQTMMNKQLERQNIFDCSSDELSRGITINQVLYKAYNKAIRITDMEEASLLNRGFGDTPDVRQVPQVVLNTSATYYKKVLTLAYMMLSDLSASDYDNQAYDQSFLANFDRLFKDLIRRVLAIYSEDYNFTYWKSKRQYAVCSGADYSNYFRLYIPDMLYLYQENEIPVSAFGILDTKNKASEPFSNADVYRMLFYANELHSKRVILCYPAGEEQQNAVLKSNNKDFSLKQIHGVYINIADDTSEESKENINMLINKVRTLMQAERIYETFTNLGHRRPEHRHLGLRFDDGAI